MGIFGSFKRANDVWDKSAKEVKDARKNRPKDRVAEQRGKKQQGGKK
jgi:hypothetical protein